jgi:hypothetical protein
VVALDVHLVIAKGVMSAVSPTNLFDLLRRDHRDIVLALTELASGELTAAQRRVVLDGIRLGILAHAEAEDIVVYAAFARIDATPALRTIIDRARRTHVEIETALAALIITPLADRRWLLRVDELLLRFQAHAREEEERLIPILAEAIPPELYRALAAAYATERLKSLAGQPLTGPVLARTIVDDTEMRSTATR